MVGTRENGFLQKSNVNESETRGGELIIITYGSQPQEALQTPQKLYREIAEVLNISRLLVFDWFRSHI